MDGPVLVPYDGSDAAGAALEHALDVVADAGATLHILSVADTTLPSLVRFEERIGDALEEEAKALAERARSLAEDRGVSIVGSVVRDAPREAILEYAAEHDVGCIVMGAHGRRGIGEYVLGSTTEHVVNASSVPVLTVRAGEDVTRSYPYETVLVPTDNSVHARAALELGSEIAAEHDAALHLLFVVDELPETIDPRSVRLSEDVERNATEVLDEAATIASRAGVGDVVTAIEPGSVPREITEYAESNSIDLVAMGTHGWSGFDRFLLGSFTGRVVRTAPVPVVTTTAAEDGTET
ncbi:universal stress protein [Halosolutus gelatinilyticus]|uniref:universal stress protein n=1 Tax=Halosolutus gelatinilyticus TaxID=2931975 RepID=UPI001FF651C8|nr:universal stress protein [Halosolutus gelatinilyticus]